MNNTLEIRYVTHENDAWDTYVEANEQATVYHLSAWRHIIEHTFGHQTYYLAAWQHERIVGVLLLTFLKSLSGVFWNSPVMKHKHILSSAVQRPVKAPINSSSNGDQPVQCYWHYWLALGDDLPEINLHNPKYRLMINIWQRLPLAVTRWIGPHIVKNLP